MGNNSPKSGQNHEGEEVIVEDSKGKPRVGDLTWVKLSTGSWWPALVVGSISNTYTKDVRVRLYGSFENMLVDPMKWSSELQNVLTENNGSYREIFRKSLEMDMSSSKERGKRSKLKGTSKERKKSSDHERSSSKKETKHNGLKRKLKVDSPRKGGNQNEDGELSARSPELSARRIRVMQTLGLVAPFGSPFNK